MLEYGSRDLESGLRDESECLNVFAASTGHQFIHTRFSAHTDIHHTPTATTNDKS